jgi:hypothetical protein
VSRIAIPVDLRRRVAELDGGSCAYCATSQRIVGPILEIDHVVPRARGGPAEEANLCLACPMCNGHKADRTSGVDPEGGLSAPLYNPRRERWADHFEWAEEGAMVRGKTASGRATVAALQMNHVEVVAARRLWMAAGWHPPAKKA